MVMHERSQNGLLVSQSLSLNQFGSSFFAFYANFIFGIAIETFNHYLVWTRFGALILVLGILFWIHLERSSKLTFAVLLACCAALALGLVSMSLRPFPDFARFGSNSLMIVVTVILVQGTVHQWFILHRRNDVGALSFSLMRATVLKDIATLSFAFTMPFNQAWPLILLNGSSAVFRGALLVKMHAIKAASARD
jgi:hypothetical protein